MCWKALCSRLAKRNTDVFEQSDGTIQAGMDFILALRGLVSLDLKGEKRLETRDALDPRW